MDGQVCLVTSFTPLATAENGAVVSVSKGTPYASVQLKCENVPEEEIDGYITHKTDFLMLWAAFVQRMDVPALRVQIRSGRSFRESFDEEQDSISLGEDEEVWLLWTRKNYRRFTFLKMFLPRLVVMVSPKGAFQILVDGPGRHPELQGEEWFLAISPMVTWTPEVMKC